MKQCKHYLAGLYFICWSVNTLVCLCMCVNVCACISRCLAPSCSRSFTSVLTLRPQQHPACRRDVGWGLVVLALAKLSVQAFLFCLAEQQWVNMTILLLLFNHVKKEKCSSSQLSLRVELVRYQYKHLGRDTHSSLDCFWRVRMVLQYLASLRTGRVVRRYIILQSILRIQVGRISDRWMREVTRRGRRENSLCWKWQWWRWRWSSSWDDWRR